MNVKEIFQSFGEEEKNTFFQSNCKGNFDKLTNIFMNLYYIIEKKFIPLHTRFGENYV